MNMLHLKGLDKKSVWKFLADYFFMFLLIGYCGEFLLK
jgi:hypothetical protein